MTALADVWRGLEILVHLGAALGFLLVGWRLGRESVGRPMFDCPALPDPGPAAAEEADPWTAASIGRGDGSGRPVAVDIFETLRSASGANDAGRGGEILP